MTDQPAPRTGGRYAGIVESPPPAPLPVKPVQRPAAFLSVVPSVSRSRPSASASAMLAASWAGTG